MDVAASAGGAETIASVKNPTSASNASINSSSESTHAVARAQPRLGQQPQIFLAEQIRQRHRDIGRFARPAQLCSWTGVTPRHHQSDDTVIRGHVTKQGSRLVRWAAVEAAQVLPHDWKLRADRDRIAARRGRAARVDALDVSEATDTTNYARGSWRSYTASTCSNADPHSGTRHRPTGRARVRVNRRYGAHPH